MNVNARNAKKATIAEKAPLSRDLDFTHKGYMLDIF
jgi:hypothetical protein